MKTKETPTLAEERIVWLVDVTKMPALAYVRVGHIHTLSRSTPLYSGAGVTLGYTVAKRGSSDWADKLYTRRVFFLKEHDRVFDPRGVYKKPNRPSEAVVPESIRCGFRAEPGERR